MVNIMNTVYKNSMVEVVKKLKAEKKEQNFEKHNQYILIADKYLKALEDFQPKMAEETGPRRKFTGLLLESRKKDGKARKKRLKLEFIGTIKSLMK